MLSAMLSISAWFNNVRLSETAGVIAGSPEKKNIFLKLIFIIRVAFNTFLTLTKEQCPCLVETLTHSDRNTVAITHVKPCW